MKNQTEKLAEAVRDEQLSGRSDADIVREFVKAGWPQDQAHEFVQNVRDAAQDPMVQLDTHNNFRDIASGFLWVGGGAALIALAVAAGFPRIAVAGLAAIAWGGYLAGRGFFRMMT